jgi:outer membrane protein assembly complex protein YaeT
MSPCAQTRSRRCRSAAIAALACLVLGGSACREDGTLEVKKLDIDGAHQVGAGAIKGVLATKVSSRLPWGRNTYFDRGRFDADLARIKAFYADRGFPDARVRSVDAKVSDDQREIALTIHLDEGEPVIVDGVRFSGFDVLPPRVRTRLERQAPLKSGAPLDRTLLASGRDTAVAVLKEHGFPYGTVAVEPQPVEGDARRVVVTYHATPGQLARFGDIQVAGNISVDDEVIRRQLLFQPGDPYRESRILDSQSALYNLELFQFANVEPLPAGGQPASVPMRVTVAEGKHRRVTFSVGYGSEEKARTDLRWSHTNFMGGARSLAFAGRWSSLDRGAKVDFLQPYFLSPHFSLGVSGQAWNTAEPAYTSNTVGGRVTLTHRANPRSSWSVALFDEYQSSAVTDEALNDLTLRDELIAMGLDPVTGKQSGTAVGFALDVQQATVRNLLDARRGYYAALHFEQAGGWLPGSFDYYTLSGDLRHYQPLPARAVIASRVQWGVLDDIARARSDLPPELTSTKIPFSKRFFLGGSTSLRGWGRFDVSPLSEAGLPIGGQTMFAWTSELRVPLTEKLSAVAFVDAGNVWADPWGARLNDLLYDVGPGLRYRTPIGPIRVDFGYQLTRLEGLLVNGEPEKHPWRIHFSIGQAF